MLLEGGRGVRPYTSRSPGAHPRVLCKDAIHQGIFRGHVAGAICISCTNSAASPDTVILRRRGLAPKELPHSAGSAESPDRLHRSFEPPKARPLRMTKSMARKQVRPAKESALRRRMTMGRSTPIV